MVDRLTGAGEAELACLTDEELESIGADEGTPFRPAAPPERLRSLSDEARRAVLTTALRSLIARGLVRAPRDDELQEVPANGRLDLDALGDLDLVLRIRRGPTAVAFVGQASYLAALHGFRDEQTDGFLEERIDARGLHHFTLRRVDETVQALTLVADPERWTGERGPAFGEPRREIPDDVSRALRDLAPGVTRVDAYHSRPAGTRRVQLSVLARPDETSVVSSAFGVAPEPPRLFRVNRDGLQRLLRATLCDGDPGVGQDPEADPGTSRYRCPVCGYPGLAEQPRTPEGGGSYEICPSCGFQFGVSDDDLGYTDESWRRGWIEAGMPWSSRAIGPPEGWDPRAQLQSAQDG